MIISWIYYIRYNTEVWCWRRLLRVLWTARRSNQSALKEINPEYSLEGLMLKLKLQYFGYLKNWLFQKDPDAGKDWRQEEKGTTEDEMIRRHHQINGYECEQTGKQWRTGKPGVLQSMGLESIQHGSGTKQEQLGSILSTSPTLQ